MILKEHNAKIVVEVSDRFMSVTLEIEGVMMSVVSG